MYRRALTVQEKSLGEDHLSTLDSIFYLGIFYQDQDKLKEAELMYERALLGYHKQSFPDTTRKLDLFCRMGLLYLHLEEYDKAIRFSDQAHEGYKSLLGSQHDCTIDALKQLHFARYGRS